jgi:hypothetical protein
VPEVLELLGYNVAAAIDVGGFSLDEETLSIGGDLVFSFFIEAREPIKLRLEYAVDYVKASGKRSRKIFQISKPTMNKGQKKSYSRKHSFADRSTRKHYPGLHSITLIINGTKQGTLDFVLSSVT